MTVVGWQTMTWVFTGTVDLNKTYNSIAIIPDSGVVGSGQVYYFDDITLVSDGAPPTGSTLPVTFEEVPPPTLTGFGGAEDATVVTDPVAGSGNVASATGEAAGGAVALYGCQRISPGCVNLFGQRWMVASGSQVEDFLLGLAQQQLAVHHHPIARTEDAQLACFLCTGGDLCQTDLFENPSEFSIVDLWKAPIEFDISGNNYPLWNCSELPDFLCVPAALHCEQIPSLQDLCEKP